MELEFTKEKKNCDNCKYQLKFMCSKWETCHDMSEWKKKKMENHDIKIGYLVRVVGNRWGMANLKNQVGIVMEIAESDNSMALYLPQNDGRAAWVFPNEVEVIKDLVEEYRR